MFQRFFGRERNANRAITDALYAQIVAAARQTVLYSDWNVPDTPLGRFEMVSLVMFLFQNRLYGETGPSADVAQVLIDEFFTDVEHSLRELGISDVGVPKRMKKLARMFYGRVTAYGTALDAGDGPALAAALTRNIRPDLESWPYAGLLGAYVFYCRDRLRDTADEALAAGEISFMDAEAIQPVGDEKADDHE